MIPKIRGITKIFFFIVATLYPALIFYFLVIRKVETRLFSLFVMTFALLAFITGTGLSFRRKSGGPDQKNVKTRGVGGSPPLFWNFLLIFVLGALCLIVNSSIILKFYPLLMNGLFLAAFGSTLFFPPSMIFRFATIQDKSIRGSLTEKRVSDYCRKVTHVWCAFFVFNGSIAAWTIFFGTDALWSVYNGVISYILIGVLFMGEFIVRKIVQKKMPEAVPLSKFKINSRPFSTVLCYEGRWSDAVYKTWGDFLQGTARLRQQIDSVNSEKWLLHCEDYWLFLLAFASLLQCKKEILLSANVSPDYIAEIRGMETQGRVPFLTDKSFSEDERHEDVFFIPSLLQAASEVQTEEAPAPPQINPDETSIIMYTSGSTGKPKAVKQRMTEFENDNRFVLSKWGEEFLKRKLCATVSQHHIYGLLFSILLPFTAGVPFRRARIEFPEELETLSDTEYMIITVPAFLKRAAEIEKRSSLNLSSPWIFTSGGAVDLETAKKTSEVFGFWPVEVYGSTETSGIAWRQSVNGQEWTPFENAQINLNKEGCLLIRSPYIKNPKGFETADMAEILEDGRFLLKGRIDSVVKIEEKRVSLPEIESRIAQSGFAADACVIPLQDTRQYLASAVVFNEEGKERFAGLEKRAVNAFWREYLSRYFENVVIPKKWRYLDALPLDAQGKKSREKIELLFTEGKPGGSNGFMELAEEKLITRTGNTVSLEFSVPERSSYFDGHFPGFPILPAVAQADIVLRYAARYLGTGVMPSEIRRMKFINLIRPLTPHLLRIEKKEETLVFTITSLSGEVVYSTGTFVEKS
jgi:acyl-CoA synthetase (AMP-forming)/AMP-acid ligase II/3-hydroxymyristoyl/3-hydroxydecanoyl-(acyl carrier protein) dehydratase/intracellular septation protein A